MSSHVSFRVDQGTWVFCYDYGEQRTPILAVTGIHADLSISGSADLPISDHLEFARDLAEKAAAYLAALERFAAAQPGPAADSAEAR